MKRSIVSLEKLAADHRRIMKIADGTRETGTKSMAEYV